MKTESSFPMTKREHDTRLLGELQGSSRESSHTAGVKLDLVDLLARVEGAEGADRELDARVWCACDGSTFDGAYDRGRGFFYRRSSKRYRNLGVGPYTASLDAALALCERVLPGWTWDLTSEETAAGKLYTAVVWSPDYQWDTGEHEAKAPALALLAALLTALITQAQPSQTGDVE